MNNQMLFESDSRVPMSASQIAVATKDEGILDLEGKMSKAAKEPPCSYFFDAQKLEIWEKVRLAVWDYIEAENADVAKSITDMAGALIDMFPTFFAKARFHVDESGYLIVSLQRKYESWLTISLMIGGEIVYSGKHENVFFSDITSLQNFQSKDGLYYAIQRFYTNVG